MKAFARLHAESVDGGLRQPQLRVAEAARRAHSAEPVAPLRPLDGDEALFDLALARLGARIERFVREPPPAVTPHRLDVLRRRRIVRASVERVDALVVAEADPRQNLLRAHGLGAHLADGVLDLLREDRRVDLAGGKELLDELLVLAGEPVRLLVREAGELAPERLPQRASAVLVEPGKKLDQDPLAKARGVHGDEEETHVAELLAGLLLLPIGRIDDEPAYLGRPVEVVSDGEHPVLEVPIDALAVVLLLVHVEEDVRRVASAVLGDD